MGNNTGFERGVLVVRAIYFLAFCPASLSKHLASTNHGLLKVLLSGELVIASIDDTSW